ncbi:MAG TPA: amidohydrolase family protein [Pararhodobacter sp.]|uniref:amidohydrolase family protein n=1 Tax=Pararhodobacter sp. TaxID=2127056 RepID=UPI002B872977|nr:amidohydrolase family protein [Pararhodobacter sp.]HPD92439.1 amidohydrolase family protein [Pararhodobacter sp.]
MQIIDAHHHLWDLERNAYPWNRPDDHDRGWGDTQSLRRSFLPHHLQAEARAAGVTLAGSVHVQANWDPADPVGETRWLAEVAAEPGANGLPQAIVAFADLSADTAPRVLADHAAFAAVRGIRQVLNRHPDPRLNRAPRDFLADPDWRRGFARLADHGFSFDAQIYYQQAPALADLARAHPETTIVLDHALMPAERGEAHLAGWRDAVSRLADCPNTVMKISGFGMVDNQWTVETIRPFVAHCLAAFGPDRAMFGSNFPVDRLMASYAKVWGAFDILTASLPASARDALFVGTAAQTYRI